MLLLVAFVKDRFYKARNKTSLDKGGEKKMSLKYLVSTFGSYLLGNVTLWNKNNSLETLD